MKFCIIAWDINYIFNPTVVNVGLEPQSYTVREQSGSVNVCARFNGDSDIPVPFTISAEPGGLSIGNKSFEKFCNCHF